jgi:DNA-binding transcriptional regulator YhcF (GntR family)
MIIKQQVFERRESYHPELTMKQNAERMGYNYNTYRRVMQELTTERVFERTGKGKYKNIFDEDLEKEKKIIKDKDYQEMKAYMGNWNRNYSIVDKERWKELYRYWRQEQDAERDAW